MRKTNKCYNSYILFVLGAQNQKKVFLIWIFVFRLWGQKENNAICIFFRLYNKLFLDYFKSSAESRNFTHKNNFFQLFSLTILINISATIFLPLPYICSFSFSIHASFGIFLRSFITRKLLWYMQYNKEKRLV